MITCKIRIFIFWHLLTTCQLRILRPQPANYFCKPANFFPEPANFFHNLPTFCPNLPTFSQTCQLLSQVWGGVPPPPKCQLSQPWLMVLWKILCVKGWVQNILRMKLVMVLILLINTFLWIEKQNDASFSKNMNENVRNRELKQSSLVVMQTQR